MSVPRILGMGPESPGMLPRCWVSRYHNTAKHTHGTCLPGVAPTVTVGVTVKILQCYLGVWLQALLPVCTSPSEKHLRPSVRPSSSVLTRAFPGPGKWSLCLSSLTH